jgi:hypothetical protein
MVFNKRVQWSVLCLVGSVLFAATPVFAVEHGAAILAPVGDEQAASANVTLKEDTGAGVIEFSVKCTGLTPGKIYTFNVTVPLIGGAGETGVADQHGKLWLKGFFFAEDIPGCAIVDRLDIDGSTVSYQTVLFGAIVWK